MFIMLNMATTVGVLNAIVDKKRKEAVYLNLFVAKEDLPEFKRVYRTTTVANVNSRSSKQFSLNFTSMNIDTIKELPNEFGGYIVTLVNSFASSKSVGEFQYLLVKRKENPEEQEEELKKHFLQKNLKKLALPIAPEWEEYFWEEIRDLFIPLKDFGKVENLPYKGYVIDLSNFETLQDVVYISHSKYEWKKYFKRIPKIRHLLKIRDVQGFNFKSWQRFMKKIDITAYEDNIAYSLIYAYEVMSNYVDADDMILKYANKWWHTSIAQHTIMIKTAKNKQEKQKIANSLLTLIENIDKVGGEDMFNNIVNNFENLYKEQYQNIKNKNWSAIVNWLETIRYENVESGAEELAVVCGKAKVSESEFMEFQKQFLEHLNDILVAPRSYPTIGKDLEEEKVGWELLDMSQPRAWTVGIETYCCMHPYSVGGACLLYAAKNPETSGILRITDSKNKTIAQSFMWISKPDANGDRTMVLDNIEVAGNEIRNSVKAAYKDFAKTMKKFAKLFRIKAITVGAGYTDIDLSDLCEEISKDSKYYAPLPESLEYTDARTQWLLKKFDKKDKKS